MRIIILLTLSLVVPGCVTVKHWTPTQHESVMLSCRTICGKDKVKSYEPLTGTCECHGELL